MAVYNSTHTGTQIDSILDSAFLKSEAQTLSSTIDSTYLKITDAGSTYLTKTEGQNLFNNKLKKTMILQNVNLTGTNDTIWQYSGQSFTLTSEKIVYATAWYSANPCYGLAICSSSTAFSHNVYALVQGNDYSSKHIFMPLPAGTYYIWVKTAGRSNCHVYTYDI